MGNCKTKRDYALIEFLEYIQDGSFQEARQIFEQEGGSLRLLEKKNNYGQ